MRQFKPSYDRTPTTSIDLQRQFIRSEVRRQANDFGKADSAYEDALLELVSSICTLVGAGLSEDSNLLGDFNRRVDPARGRVSDALFDLWTARR